jgi:tetratricopeptide (TPR) repeat protein
MITNKSSRHKGQSLWNYFLTVIGAAAMGAAITWLVMSQSQRSTSNPPPFAARPLVANAAEPDVSGMSPGEAAVVLGNFAYDHQQWPEAIRQYQQAIAGGMDTADVRTDLGNAFRFSGLAQQALDQYTIAQRINPQHENSLFNQISLFAEALNDPARARAAADEFSRRFPNSDKLPTIRQQMAEIKAPNASASPPTLDDWLKKQQRKP